MDFKLNSFKSSDDSQKKQDAFCEKQHTSWEEWEVSRDVGSSRKYPYLPHRRDFPRPLSLWKFQLSLINFFKCFGVREPPTPHEIPIPSVGEYEQLFSGTVHCT